MTVKHKSNNINKKGIELIYKPQVFIGSSSESIEIASKFADFLRAEADVRVWTDVFDLGDVTIETLFRQLDISDYAILIATGDDKIRSRGKEKNAPRDNVIFEAGLFMGKLGRKRTFVVCDEKLKLPSDLSGVTVATFAAKNQALDNSLESAAKRVLHSISMGTPEREVDFLRAYLAFIDPRKIKLWHTYSEILTNHYNVIKAEVNQLQSHRDWGRLLKVKERLREYFEYSGMYREGVDFGISYVTALLELGKHYEAAWSQIKDVGYMLILSGEYNQGREAIQKVINSFSEWVPSANQEQKATLLFYAHRYISISYYRDKAFKDLESACQCLSLASDQLSYLDATSHTYQELSARLSRNMGHLELEQNRIQEAIKCYRRSLKLFDKIKDVEHIGTTCLSLAMAQIRLAPESWEDPLPYLKKAENSLCSHRVG